MTERTDIPHVDVFVTLYTAYQNCSLNNTVQKQLVADLFQRFRKSKVIGGRRFPGEAFLGRLRSFG